MGLRLGELDVVLRADPRAFERGLDDARQRFQEHGQQLEVASSAVGVAMGVALAAGLAGAMELDKARARLTAQVGDPALARHLGEVAGDVYGRGFGDSAAQSMQAVRDIMQTGLVPQGDAAALEDLTVKAHAYADAWGTDIADAVSTASTLVRSGIAKDATHALDLLTVASRKVPAAMVDDLQEASAEYAQFFRGLGFSGEQAFSLLAAGSDKGKWGIDKVGDAIKEFSILATELEGPPADALRALGFNARQMQNDLLAGGDTARAAFDKTIDALLRVKDPAEQAQLAMDVFGTPLEDLSKTDIPEFLRSLDRGVAGLGDVEGASKQAADALEQSAGQQLDAFGRRVQSALVEKLAEALPTLERVAGWLERNSDFVLALGTVLGGIAITIGVVTAATKAWAIAQMVLNVAMMLNPIGLVILLIVGLIAIIVGLWMKSEAFRNFWIGLWEGIMVAAAAVGTWFRDVLWKQWIVGSWNGITSAGERALGWFRSLPGKMGRAVSGLWNGLVSGFRSAMNTIIGKWNNFSLTLGGGSVLGMGIPSVTLSTPNIPYLAEGGHIMRAGTAVVGDRGPELVHLGRGATVQPLTGGGAGRTQVTLRLIHETPDGRVIREELIDYASQIGVAPAALLPAA